MLEQLNLLKNKYEFVGDVRGAGLFIGIEMVTDKQSKEPSERLASLTVNHLRLDYNILLSTDGPFHNVLKFKPPLVISREDINRFLSCLDAIFSAI